MTRLRAATYRPIPACMHGRRARTRGVVIHTIEGSAAGAISWFANPACGGVGAHVVFGKDTVTQVADLDAICWHAPGANYDCIGFEHEGRAAYTRKTWLGPYRTMLRKSANRTGWVCWYYNLGRPKRGKNVFGHVDFPAGGHHDPGGGWPWKRYLAWANVSYAALKLSRGKTWSK